MVSLGFWYKPFWGPVVVTLMVIDGGGDSDVSLSAILSAVLEDVDFTIII